MIGLTFFQSKFRDGYDNLKAQCLQHKYLKTVRGKSVGGKPVSPLQKSGSCKMVVTKSHITNWTSASANNGEWLVSEQSEYQGQRNIN